jgi:hypothetical protein
MRQSGALEAIDRILNRGGDADDVLRAVVRILVELGGCSWAGILFVEDGELVLGPQAGDPVRADRLQLPVTYKGETVAELVAAGFTREEIGAAARAGLVVRIGPDLVVAPALVARGERVVQSSPRGITVSAFREALGTTRKYAVPLLEWFDQRGLTRRVGDVRVPRG